MSGRRWRRRASLVAACAFASGCSFFHPVGPDYRSPAETAATLNAAKGKAFSPESPPGPWWRLYSDSILDGYVDEALRENRDLRAAASRIEMAQAQLDQAKSAQWPSTSVSANGGRQRDWIDGSPVLMIYNSINAKISASYELDLFGRIRRSIEAASASTEEQQFAFAATQIRVVASTVGAYVGVCQANASLASVRRTVQIDKDELATLQQLAKGGTTSQFDVTRARARLESDSAQLPTIEAQRMSSLYALAVLLGRQPDRYPAEAAQCQAPPTIARPLPVGDGLALLRRRPDVAESERALASATAGIGVAIANLYPQISLGASFGFSGSNMNNTFNTIGRTWSLGPLVQWTFPNVEATEAQIHQAGASADLAKASYDSTVLNALKETSSALDSYARELAHWDGLRQSRDSNRVALEQAQKLYRHGVVPYLDVLSAQKSLAQAEEQLVKSAGAVASDQVAVFYALGGGWDETAQAAAAQAMAAMHSRQTGAAADAVQ
jgi:NodT family efflux transporter outer membrane factor (OMF) lipoprotein